MAVILFEDEGATQLYPITLSRPAYAISCGSYCLLDLVAGWGTAIRTLIRPHLREVRAMDATGADSMREPTMLLNARVVPSVDTAAALRAFYQTASPAIVRQGETVVAAILDDRTPPPNLDFSAAQLREYLDGLALPEHALATPLFEYPHDVIRHHLALLRTSLEHRIRHGGYREVHDGVFVANGATLGQYVVTDTSDGPVVLESGASIGPYCLLSGPAYVGPDARVIEHSAIKHNVSLGQTTKIGGEVEGSIIEAFTNKQHHGFLGHSYLGSWINLGAGTCNSDLKNTYGHVKMDYNGQKVATGMQFVGCIVGDYAKTAINTGIFTGKTIGVCSMIYGFVTTNVPSYVNYARSFGQVTETPVEVMVATQARMFARRNVVQRPCDIQLIHDMHALTRHERQIAGDPLSL